MRLAADAFHSLPAKPAPSLYYVPRLRPLEAMGPGPTTVEELRRIAPARYAARARYASGQIAEDANNDADARISTHCGDCYQGSGELRSTV